MVARQRSSRNTPAAAPAIAARAQSSAQALAAVGINDKSIADQLGISARTLDRRIETLLSGLDARTRFQPGWQAALRNSGNAKTRTRR